MTHKRIRLEYVHPWPNHIGFFVARKKGWLAEKGWDIDIISDGYDRGAPRTLLESGDYDVAMLGLADLLESRRGDEPLIGVATLNQRQIPGVFTRTGRGIARFRDLEGKRVGVPSTPRLLHTVREAVEADGGDFDKVSVVDLAGWEPDMRAIEKGQFDAVFNVLGWEPLQGGVTTPDEIVRLDPVEVGVPKHHAYFVCLRASDLATDPTFARDLLECVTRGYEFAREHPDEAIEITHSAMQNMEPAVLRASLDYMEPSWFSPSGRWGEINVDRVRDYAKWLVDGGFSEGRIADAEGAVTNDYLP